MIKSNVKGIAIVYPRADEGMNSLFKVSSGQKWFDLTQEPQLVKACLHNRIDLYIVLHTLV